MLRYKFKHLEKHHRKELNEKIYRVSRNYDTIGELCETIDTIIDIYLANGDNAIVEQALHKHIVNGSFDDFKEAVNDINEKDNYRKGWGGREIRIAFNALLSALENCR